MRKSRPKLQATALAPDDAARWQDLPPELVPRVLARLPTNEVPCTARLVCKAAKAELSSPEHTTIRLSQPSPHGDFVRRWGAPGAMWPLTLVRRRRLLSLTAASGCLHNLTWLAEHVGCLPDASVLEAAAAAGRLEACRWLLQQQQGGEGLPTALAAAAGAGQRSTLEALLAHPGAQNLPDHLGEDFRAGLAICAARGGHAGLADWLVERFRPATRKPRELAGWEYELLCAAAAGCELATLQRLLFARQPGLAQLGQERTGGFGRILGCAASSRTPDWKAKVEWLEACLGTALDDEIACAKAAACPDALERLTWLRARGCPWDGQAVTAAACAGNVEALSYLLAKGCAAAPAALQAAAEGGHVAALEVLHSRGGTAANAGAWANAALAAARGGQLPAVRWMWERRLVDVQLLGPGGDNPSPTHLVGAAASSGSIELLAWLRARGSRWGVHDLDLLAFAGSVEALEWAVAHDCPMQEPLRHNHDPYFSAAKQGDWVTLACLRRLGAPMRSLNRNGGTFADAVREGCSVPILGRLLDIGCPVDWRRAAQEAKDRDRDVRVWLTEEEQRRQEAEDALYRQWQRLAARAVPRS